MPQQNLNDYSAAFLAACIVAKSDKIQSTRFAVDVWEELRGELKINSRFDYLTAILSQGRLMDLKIDENNYIEQVKESLDVIRHELVIRLTYPILGEKDGSEVLADSYIVRLNDLASAIMASAVIYLSQKVESSKEIIRIWDQIREMDIVNNNNDYLAALLVASRISDLKKELKDSHSLDVIIENFKSILSNIEPTLKVSKNDLASAYLTIAIISQTPEIESHKQILDLWQQLKSELKLKDFDNEVIAAILASGLIRNMTLKIDINYVKDIYSRIRTRLQEIYK